MNEVHFCSISNQPKNNPEDVVSTYAQYIVDQNYEEMYNLISENSKAQTSQEDLYK